MRPTVAGTLILLAGRPKFGWFRTLNDSTRNSSRILFGQHRVLEDRRVPVEETRAKQQVSSRVPVQ